MPSIVTMALSCISSEIKRDIGRTYPLAFNALVWGSLSDNFLPVWYGKTRMVGLDGRTFATAKSAPRCAYAMRGKNNSNSMIELVNKAYYSTMTELKFSVTVQDIAVVSSRMCPKITKDVASDVTRTCWW